DECRWKSAERAGGSVDANDDHGEAGTHRAGAGSRSPSAHRVQGSGHRVGVGRDELRTSGPRMRMPDRYDSFPVASWKGIIAGQAGTIAGYATARQRWVAVHLYE